MWVTLYFFVHTAADATMFEDNLGSSSILGGCCFGVQSFIMTS